MGNFGFGRDNIGNFGDKIAGLAYNAVPEDCLQSFLDDDCTIGTVAAALIAGSTCGAAPFSKVISIKVGRSSGHCRPDWIVAGKFCLYAVWHHDHIQSNCCSFTIAFNT